MWNFSLNCPCSWENLRIHCFPGSLLMCKCCSALCSALFSLFTSLYSQGKNLHSFLIQEQNQGQPGQRPVATASGSNTPSLPWENQLQNREGGFRRWIFAPLLPARIHLWTSLLRQALTILLPAWSCPSPVYALLVLGPTFIKKG